MLRVTRGLCLRFTTGAAFQMAPEGLLVALQKQYLLFAWGWIYTTEPSLKQSAIQNLSKHKSEYSPHCFTFFQFLLSVFPSSRLVPHNFLFLTASLCHAAPAVPVPVQAGVVTLWVTPMSSALLFGISSAFSLCLLRLPLSFFAPPAPLYNDQLYFFFQARREKMS